MRTSDNLHELAFFKSALVKEGVINPIENVLNWIYTQNKRIKTSVDQISLADMKRWKFDETSGNLSHESRKFFSIEGIRVKTNYGNVEVWEQPIINQPEIGFLGILAKNIKGVLNFLMQAKVEPGNLNCVQLSPTLQATKSNYTKVHHGKSPLFLEYFNGQKQGLTLLDQLQSEQGARFLRKRNRNMIVQIGEDEALDLPENFLWLTLGQIKELMKFDNVVNMDTRTVISAIPYGSYNSDTLTFFSEIASPDKINLKFLASILNHELHLHTLDQIISWITKLKTKYALEVTSIPLNKVSGWKYDGRSVVHEQKKYFEVIGVHVEINNREVIAWDQPMIKPAQEGIIAFIVKNINGVCHFLVQAKAEAGNLDILELAPTVQCLTGNYRDGQSEYTVPFIHEVMDAPQEKIWYSAMQSEEGGRFFKEQNINRIVEAPDDFPIEVPDNYCWMTLNQLLTFLKFNNYLNIATRSLISTVSF
ncbi:MAG: NDP-hexose 2,3-dehydratase family protein [Bacteroidales bacterium]|nr:NDP-hexose 2,3-dehydratase family protein [Bacteroidales bacterium]